MTMEELGEILKKHKLWLKNEDSGERADLQGADLRCADLREADLRGADLQGADLREADLRGADLQGADLRDAYLRDAYLRGADLQGAYLRGAYLRGADLRGADLQGAKIEGDLLNALVPICCPETGSFIAWKKAGNKIVKLEVCEDALRSSAFGRKCRCSKASVLRIENIDGSDSGFTEISSDYSKDFVYKVGDIVEVKNFDKDRKNECAPGIHFFITRNEAVEY